MTARRKTTFILSLAILLELFSQAAFRDLYFAASNYSTGNMGTIRHETGGFIVSKNQVSNLGRDAFGYTIIGPDANSAVLLHKCEYGPNDHIMLYDANGN